MSDFSNHEALVPNDPPKKKRGRPLGVKNKPKQGDGRWMGKAAMQGVALAGTLPPVSDVPLSLRDLTDDDYGYLVRQIGDGDAKAADELRWAAKYAFYHPAEIDPSTVPSRAAVLLLKIVHDDKQRFFEQYTKLLPSKTQIEASERFRDDGRNALSALEAFAADIAAEATEGDQSEPPVAQEAAGMGG